MEETKAKVTIDPKSIILDVIDQLRQRKARPDLVRISHMVQRKHGLSYQDTEAELERLVERNVVLKVDYKGDISYRNAEKWRKSHLGGNVLNAKSTSTRIMEALTALQNENENSENHSGERKGASMADIEKWIAENYTVSELTSNGPNDIIRNRLDVALQREVEICHVVRLANGNYIMGNLESHNNVRHSNEQSPVENGSSLSTQESNNSFDCYNTVMKDKRARKKKNRSFDPADYRLLPKKNKLNNKMKNKSRKVKDMIKVDHAEVLPPNITMEIPKLQIQETSRNSSPPTSALTLGNVFDQKCDYCRQSASTNLEGVSEELLICEDCNAKAHPYCMNYSRELARRALTSPWQCIDCKTCCICTDADDAAEMLFCDACDKGYHMKCHRPAIVDKPSGKWVCNRCVYDACQVADDSLTEPASTLSRVSSINDFNGNKLFTVIKSVPLEFTMDQVMCWNIDEVVQFIADRGFSDQAEKFREQEIDGKSLLLMKRLDILTGMRMKLGPALKIHRDISRLHAQLVTP